LQNSPFAQLLRQAQILSLARGRTQRFAPTVFLRLNLI